MPTCPLLGLYPVVLTSVSGVLQLVPTAWPRNFLEMYIPQLQTQTC